MSEVFLSYKAEDRPRLRPLVAALEAEGLAVWWDAHIEGGDDWRESIGQQLEAARCVLVAWSKRSTGPQGRFVRDEATRAQRRHVYLPVLIDAVEPPLGFGETQALPLVGWKGDRADPRFQALVASVRGVLDGKRRATAMPAAAAPRIVDRRAVLAGGGVLALGAAGAGGWLLFGSSPAAAADSIAVLPFANFSGDPAQAYFSDGMAEELRSALARIARLKVMARTSSEMVRGADAKEAASRLGVASILTGSVRRSPGTLRVNAQLVDGRDGLERWSESYDRPEGDALQIQTSIAESVAQALSIQLAPAERDALAGEGTDSAAAHDLFLKGRAIWLAGGGEAELRQSLALFDAAISADPSYVAAHAERSRVVFEIANGYETGAALSAALSASLASARRAVELNPKSAVAQSALANALDASMNLAAASERHRLAYRLAPGDPGIAARYAEFLSNTGRSEAALPLIAQVIERDPLNPSVYRFHAKILLYARRYEDSARVARRAAALGPKSAAVYAMLGEALVLGGKPDEALAAFSKVELDWDRRRGEAIATARAGDRAAADRALERFKEIDDGSLNFQFAQIHAQRGEPELAIRALQVAERADDPGLAYVRADPMLDPLRADPRFQALEKRLNFP